MPGKRTPYAAKQPAQRQGSQSNGAFAIGFAAQMPAAFEPDQKANRQRYRQPLEQFESIHAGQRSALAPPVNAAVPRC